MNQNQRLTTQLIQLNNIIKDAKTIIEWHKLRLFEKKSNRSSEVFFQDDTLQQLTDKTAAFPLLWSETSTLLQNNRINLSQGRKCEIQKELKKLSLQFFYLGSDVRIY
jgi:hypothetical protein